MSTSNFKNLTISIVVTMSVLVFLSGIAAAASVSGVKVGSCFGMVSYPGDDVRFSLNANDGLHGGSPPVAYTGSGGPITLANGDLTTSYYAPTTDGSKQITVKPEAGYKIKEIRFARLRTDGSQYYMQSSSSSVPTDPTVPWSFNISISNNSSRNYLIWVTFELNANTVVSSVADDSPVCNGQTPPCSPLLAHCSATGSIVEVIGGVETGTEVLYPGTLTKIVAPDATMTIKIKNSNPDCEIAGINFDTAGTYTMPTTLTGRASGSTYTTPPITNTIGNAAVKILFRHKGFTITVTKTDTTPSCGSYTPTDTDYEAGETVLFTFLKNTGCAIDSIVVDGTDETATITSATNPTGINTLKFTNVQANHTVAVTFVKVSTTLGSEYCQRPAFMLEQATLKPNVLMILDNSGSMGGTSSGMGLAYRVTGKTYGCTGTSPNNALGSGTCNKYYGYFNPTKMYKLSGSTYVLSAAAYDPATTSAISSTVSVSGNYLNYYNAQKVDVLRKILVGGRVDDSAGAARGATTGTYYLSQNDGKVVQYIPQDDETTEPTGIVHSLYDKVRFGIMTFNGNGSDISLSTDGGHIAAKLGSSLTSLVNIIEGPETDPDSYTPLAESLYEAVRYYKAKTSAFNSTDYATQNTVASGVCTAWNGCPATDSPPELNQIIQYSCQKNFVMLITDGEPTKDQNIPGNPDYSETATDANFSLSTWWDKLAAADRTLVTSGTTKYWLPAVAYYAHNTDLRSTALGNDMSGTQNLTVYTVYAFGTGAGTATLTAAAKYGAYKDGTTGTAGFPDAGEYANSYYAANDGALLKVKLEEAFANILDSAGSGTAAAVANNKSGERGANMLQALFYPQWPTDTTKKWMGEVQALWYYLDPIIGYSNIYEDSNIDNKLDLAVDGAPNANPFLTKSLWRAGGVLHARTDSRNIYTLLGSNKNLTDASNTFTSSHLTSLRTPMNLGVSGVGTGLTDAQATILIDYIRGTDATNYRSRKVTFTDPSSLVTTTNKEWKLGDIVNSTPMVQSSVAINAYNIAYSDLSYDNFIKSTAYKAKNVVYTGSNDGLFHAFKLGTVTAINDATHPLQIASMTGTDRGKEEWAFIPSNALPYIQNQAGTDYCHQCLVDGAPVVVDASINIPTGCTSSNYWECERKTTVSSENVLDAAATSWKSVVVSSMGLGGATRDKGTATDMAAAAVAARNCNETYGPNLVATDNKDCVKTPITGNGMSSYFALDVSNPLSPQFMWEFSDTQIPLANKAYDHNSIPAVVTTAGAKGLGFTTPGAAIIRINAVDASTPPKVVKKNNGRWFAVMASGPTGSITATQTFTGHSDQNLKIYVVDLNGGSTFTQCTSAGASGCNYWVMDTGIPFAFANSLNGAAIDLDRSSPTKDGNYSDDVVYITYTKASLTYNASDPNGYFPSNETAWNKGGVIRLVTNHNPDPFTWFTSKLIDDVGPITTSVGRIQDKANKKLWVYFGEGRSFFPGDETNTRRRFYGVADPCYTQYGEAIDIAAKNADNSDLNFALGKTVATCPTVTGPAITDSYTADVGSIDLQRQDTPSAALTSGKKGWYVNMAASAGTAGAERVVSDVAAAFNGTVFYTTYLPNTDPCQPGGNTSVWAVKYDTGGTPSAESMQGKAPVQTSSGGIKLIDLATAFTQNDGRKLAADLAPAGMAPKGKFPPLLSPKAAKRIINIHEQ